jgi:uncharacterized repeat protein (TIGR01451 family)
MFRSISGRLPLRLPAVALVAVLLGSLGVLAAPTAAEAAQRPLTEVYDGNVVGGFVQAGNALAECYFYPTPAGCLHTIEANQSNTNSRMRQLDVDSISSTSNSSAAVVAIPAGARVVRAQLSWGGFFSGAGINDGTANLPDSANGFTPGSEQNPVQVSVGSAAPAYASVTPDPGRASMTDNNGAANRWYNASADVTSAFTGLSGDQVMWVGGVPAFIEPNGVNASLGWGVTVVYEWPDGLDFAAGHIRRNVSILEGQYLQTTIAPPTSQQIPTPAIVDTANVFVGAIGVEGDLDISGDVLFINGMDAANRVPEPTTGATDNFFNSTAQGTSQAGANPQWPANESIDVKRFRIPTGLVPNGSTAVTLSTQTTGDGFGILQLVLSVPVAALAIEKTADSATYSSAGDVIDYSFRVQNVGSSSIDNVSVVDPLPGLSTITCPTGANGSFSLAPDTETICTASYTVTQADAAGDRSITNTASANGTTPGGQAVESGESTVTVACDDCESLIAITKSHLGGPFAAGDTVTYDYVITNTGDSALNDVQLTDNQAGISAPTCTPASGSSLQPGAQISCTATYVVTVADVTAGAVPNGTATTTATSAVGAQVQASDDDPASTVAAVPSITVEKAAPNTPVSAGDVVTYTYTVTNTGNVPLNDVQLADPQSGLSALTCDPALGSTLQPGASITCTATTTVTTADVVNGQLPNGTATGSGQPATGGTRITGSDDETVPTVAAVPSITVEKTHPDRTYREGETVTFTYTVTNTGNVPLNDVQLDDDQPGLSAFTCDPALGSTLQPGASITCTATVVTTAADAAGGFTASGTATATGAPSSGGTVVVAANSDRVVVDDAPVGGGVVPVGGGVVPVDGGVAPSSGTPTAPQTPGGGLAYTGSDLAGLLLAAGVLLSLGLLAKRRARRMSERDSVDV